MIFIENYKKFSIRPFLGVPGLWDPLGSSGKAKISKNNQNKQFWAIFDPFSRFLPQILCIYAIGTWKQHFLIKFRVPRGRRGPK